MHTFTAGLIAGIVVSVVADLIAVAIFIRIWNKEVVQWFGNKD
jgi:L-asparagine transporter-like permease